MLPLAGIKNIMILVKPSSHRISIFCAKPLIFVCAFYSFRRKRSSDNLIFTSDMVHILPGYPKNSSDDPRITLVAFYLLLPQGISDDIVHKDLLQAIVESDVSSIEKLIGGTILSVQPLFTNTATTIVESDEELAPTIVIIGASVCIALLMVIICALVLGRKRFRR